MAVFVTAISRRLRSNRPHAVPPRWRQNWTCALILAERLPEEAEKRRRVDGRDKHGHDVPHLKFGVASSKPTANAIRACIVFRKSRIRDSLKRCAATCAGRAQVPAQEFGRKIAKGQESAGAAGKPLFSLETAKE